MFKFIEEEDMQNKEAVLGSLSSFLRARNFNSKRLFVQHMNGLKFLENVLSEGSFSVRIQRKALTLTYDLVLNDEHIVEGQPTYVRTTLGNEINITPRLSELLKEASADLVSAKFWDVREYTLHILFRIFQVCPDLAEQYTE